MKRGFTIIELLVVITVIAILVGLSTMSYYQFENRAYDGQAQTLANAVRSGAEKYYSNNNEYPSAALLFGGTPTGSAPASYSAASTNLGVSTDVLNASRVKFVPCSGSVCTLNNTAVVYYLTKDTSDGTAQRQYVQGSCTFTFPTTEDGAMSYIIMYYSKQMGYWKVARSGRGIPTTSDNFWCPFRGF